MDSAFYLNITVGEFFPHKTLIEAMEIQDHITENNSFMSESKPSREERTSSHEDTLVIESDLPLSTTLDSALEFSPEPRALENEEIQPPEFPFKFEDDLFEDFGKTSKYSYKRKPPVPVPFINPIEATFYRQNVKKLYV